jgi:hypothetical protein
VPTVVQTMPMSESSVIADCAPIRIATWNMESLRRFFEVLRHYVGEKSEFIEAAVDTESVLDNFVTAFESALAHAEADVICVQEGLNDYLSALDIMCGQALIKVKKKTHMNKIHKFRESLLKHLSAADKLFKGYTCVASSSKPKITPSSDAPVELFCEKVYYSENVMKHWNGYGGYGKMKGVGEQTDQIYVRDDCLWEVCPDYNGEVVEKTSSDKHIWYDSTDSGQQGTMKKLVSRAVVLAVLRKKSSPIIKVVVGNTHVTGGRFEDTNALHLLDERGEQTLKAANFISSTVVKTNAICGYLLGDFNATASYDTNDASAEVKRQAKAMAAAMSGKNQRNATENDINTEDNITKYLEYITKPFKVMANTQNWKSLTSSSTFPTSYFVWPVDHIWCYTPNGRTGIQHERLEMCITTLHASFRLNDANIQKKHDQYLKLYQAKSRTDGNQIYARMHNDPVHEPIIIDSIAWHSSQSITDHSMLILESHFSAAAEWSEWTLQSEDTEFSASREDLRPYEARLDSKNMPEGYLGAIGEKPLLFRRGCKQILRSSSSNRSLFYTRQRMQANKSESR